MNRKFTLLSFIFATFVGGQNASAQEPVQRIRLAEDLCERRIQLYGPLEECIRGFRYRGYEFAIQINDYPEDPPARSTWSVGPVDDFLRRDFYGMDTDYTTPFDSALGPPVRFNGPHLLPSDASADVANHLVFVTTRFQALPEGVRFDGFAAPNGSVGFNRTRTIQLSYRELDDFITLVEEPAGNPNPGGGGFCGVASTGLQVAGLGAVVFLGKRRRRNRHSS